MNETKIWFEQYHFIVNSYGLIWYEVSIQIKTCAPIMLFEYWIFIDLSIVCLGLKTRNFLIQCVILCYRKVMRTSLTLLDATKTTDINFKETKSKYMCTISKMHWQHHNSFSHNSIRRNRRKYTTQAIHRKQYATTKLMLKYKKLWVNREREIERNSKISVKAFLD